MTAPHAQPGPDWNIVAAAIYPADVAEFREVWEAPTCIWWIRDSVKALSDQDVRQLIETLRGVFVKRPGMIMDVWQLVAQKAGQL